MACPIVDRNRGFVSARLAVGAAAVVCCVGQCVVPTAAAAVRAEAEPAGISAVADVVLWGHAMPPAALTSELPREVRSRLAEYRQRERAFHSALTPPPGATPDERQVFATRVDIERTIYCLFARRDSASVAAQYALDAAVEAESDDRVDAARREAKFIDSLLVNLSKPWLAPYLNLIAGHHKLCAGMDDARVQLARARDGGQPLIRAVAEHILVTNRCVEPAAR